MAKLRDPQLIELFHLAFLDVLSRKVDPGRYILKGGASLRFFFHSPRYSEDIDLDVDGVPSWRLEEKGDEILRSPQLGILLRQSGISVVEISKPKQTGTTQRWKAGLQTPDRSRAVRTKIEFSHRGGDERRVLEAVPSEMVRPYGLRPPSVQHYTRQAAAEQKVEALAARRQTQARDVFDLDLLLRSGPVDLTSLDFATRAAAAERALDLSFAEFRDQVLEFLEPDAAELYDTEEAWVTMQTEVAERVEAAT